MGCIKLVLLSGYVVYIVLRCHELYKKKGKTIPIKIQEKGNKNHELLYQISTNNIKDYKDRILNFSYYTILLYGAMFGLYRLVSSNIENVSYVMIIYYILVIFISVLGICLIIQLQYSLCKERARSTAFGDIFKESLPDLDLDENELKEYMVYSYDFLLYVYLFSNIIGFLIIYLLSCLV